MRSVARGERQASAAGWLASPLASSLAGSLANQHPGNASIPQSGLVYPQGAGIAALQSPGWAR